MPELWHVFIGLEIPNIFGTNLQTKRKIANPICHLTISNKCDSCYRYMVVTMFGITTGWKLWFSLQFQILCINKSDQV